MILPKHYRIRGGHSSHLLGISIIFLCILYRLLPPPDILQSTDNEDIIDSSRLSASIGTDDNDGSQIIPKIIHQVYLGWDSPEIPTAWIEGQQKCIDLHPDYTYMVPKELLGAEPTDMR
jgi:hypothetical protein